MIADNECVKHLILQRMLYVFSRKRKLFLLKALTVMGIEFAFFKVEEVVLEQILDLFTHLAGSCKKTQLADQKSDYLFF